MKLNRIVLMEIVGGMLLLAILLWQGCSSSNGDRNVSSDSNDWWTESEPLPEDSSSTDDLFDYNFNTEIKSDSSSDGLDEILQMLEDENQVSGDDVILPDIDNVKATETTIVPENPTIGKDVLTIDEGVYNKDKWLYEVIIYELTKSGMKGKRLSKFACDSVQYIHDEITRKDNFMLYTYEPRSQAWINIAEFSVGNNRFVEINNWDKTKWESYDMKNFKKWGK